MSATTGAERETTFPILQSMNKPQATQQGKGGLLRDNAAEDFGHVGSNAEDLQSKSKMKPAQGSESPTLQGFEWEPETGPG